MSETTPAKPGLENVDIQRILPHRFPFLLIDRIVEHQRKERIVAIKNVTANEPWVQGRFPGFPIMPGVLIVEALAQAGGVLLLSEIEDRDNKLMVFSGIDNARFRRPVLPGDTLRLEVTVLGWRANFAKMQGHAYVGDQLAAEAVLSCALVPRQDKKPGA
jgi:3-hydroxyacyl-[acyl-carrier-protein] dehydratase